MLTPEIITAAIEGFEAKKRRIDDQIAELREMHKGGNTGTAAITDAPSRKRRKLSAAARARMAEAQRKRWAASRGESVNAKAEPVKPKRRLSAATKARLAANLKRARAAKAAKAKAAMQ